MIVQSPQPIGPTVSTSSPTPLSPGSPAHGAGIGPHGLTTEQVSGADPEPILCHHCGRTASNGISCEGICVADSGY